MRRPLRKRCTISDAYLRFVPAPSDRSPFNRSLASVQFLMLSHTLKGQDMGRQIIHITKAPEGWHLVHQGRKIGPYGSEAEAASVAHAWAEIASRRSIEVEVVHESADGSEEPIYEPLLPATAVAR